MTQLQTNLVSNVPDFVKADTSGASGLTELRQIMLPSFLRVLQAQIQDEELAARYKSGDVVILPEKRGIYLMEDRIGTGGAIVPKSVPIAFTPIVYFKEWCCLNPISMRGQLPMIRERSSDPGSDLARRSRTPELRTAPCPEKGSEKLRFQEYLNFLVMLRIEDAPILPVIMSFVSAEHVTGRRFANLIISRGPEAKLYAGVYEFTTGLRQNAQGKWYGFDIANHSAAPWVTSDEYAIYREAHAQLAPKIQAGEVQPDYEAGTADGSVGEPTGGGQKVAPQNGFEYANADLNETAPETPF